MVDKMIDLHRCLQWREPLPARTSHPPSARLPVPRQCPLHHMRSTCTTTSASLEGGFCKVRQAGIEWKTGGSPKMGSILPKNGKLPHGQILLLPFLGHFSPFLAVGNFPFFHFSPFLASILYQPARLATKGGLCHHHGSRSANKHQRKNTWTRFHGIVGKFVGILCMYFSLP